MSLSRVKAEKVIEHQYLAFHQLMHGHFAKIYVGHSDTDTKSRSADVLAIKNTGNAHAAGKNSTFLELINKFAF